MLIEVQVLKAFVENNRGGNPAGVVLNADELSSSQKLQIAQAMGLSETAFVGKSKVADFKLEFFTPTKQIAHCGHATIATFSYLSQLGLISLPDTSKETIDGVRKIKLMNDLAFMEQKAPTYTQVDAAWILKSIGLTTKDLQPDSPILNVNTGNSFALIPIKDRETLAKVSPNLELVNEISEKYDLIGYYLFALDTIKPNSDATTRMFAPRYGIDEEAGTGMAAGPLASYLFDIQGVKQSEFRIEQGWLMPEPSPSELFVNLNLENKQIISLMAGGKGILAEKKWIEI
jgi:PhzF family phenazine biosynthesis protein